MLRHGETKIEITSDELDSIKRGEYMRGHDVGVEVGKEHSKSSPETKSMIEEITSEIKEHIKSDIAQHKDLNEKMTSLISKVDEIYQVYTASGFTGKVIIRLFTIIGIITGAIIGLIELFKRLK